MNSLVELAVRYVYFGLGLNNLLEKVKKHKSKAKTKVTLKQIEECFKKYGIKKGDTIMVHSSLSAIDATAEEVVNFLMDYIGEEGNILMPTHPKLKNDGEYYIYDVDSSPSYVGYLTDVFRNYKNVERSLHPFSSVAVWGKDKDFFLKDNLNSNQPLPHGIFSPYFKLTKKKGIIVCIGVTAEKRATIKHVAEELFDEKFPVKNFFKKFYVKVIKNGTELGVFIVRKADLRKSQIFIAKAKTENRLLKNGILKRYRIGEVPVEFMDSYRVVELMKQNIVNGETRYPFAPKK